MGFDILWVFGRLAILWVRHFMGLTFYGGAELIQVPFEWKKEKWTMLIARDEVRKRNRCVEVSEVCMAIFLS